MKVAVLLLASWLWVLCDVAMADEPLAWWSFDTVDNGQTLEVVSQRRDVVIGGVRPVVGVIGQGLKCDGFTTRVVRLATHAPKMGDCFSMEAWLAIQAYPWGWCPVLSQHDDRKAGFLFGIDAEGHVGLHLAIDSVWRECTTESKLRLMTWVHIAATYDQDDGIVLYIDGQRAGGLEIKGKPAYADEVDVLIGRNHKREPAMFSAYWDAPDQPVYFSFDGIIDEVKVYGHRLSDGAVKNAYESDRPGNAPALRARRLPSGPPGRKTFGAFYVNLDYTEEWDAQWRGSGPDVVVTFEAAPVRLVCWRGISYAPCWVTETGNWFNNEFLERGVDRKARGCSESMSDKRARFSHVKILENNEARSVIYWRNAPVGVNYELAYVDEATGWGDWSEEYHTVYPDGVAVRKVVMYSSDLEAWHEWCQSLEILHPGQRPEDVLDERRIMSAANMQGEHKAFGWDSGVKGFSYPTLSRANIQVTYLRSRYNPFVILDDRPGRNDKGGQGCGILRVGGDGWSRYSRFPWRNHWPVTQLPLLGRYAVAADRPAHTYTATQVSAPYETTDTSMTKIALVGMTDKDAIDLLPLAKSWLRAPEMIVDHATFANEGYDPTQRAYVLRCKQPASATIRFEASEASPVVNPCIVIKGWGERAVRVSIDEKPVAQGPKCRIGYRHQLESTDLIVWLETESRRPMSITLAP